MLVGDQPNPVTGSTGLANDLLIVVTVKPYGHQDTMSLIVAEDGTHERATFVAPSALGLKKGDVITASRLCYRSDERLGTDGHRLFVDACTDVVVPYSKPTAEAPPPPAPANAPAPAPAPDPAPGTDAAPTQAPPNPQ